MAGFKVIIIGSGLAGGLLANGLINSNIEVAVYERLQKHAKREGYQIRLGAPALIGMRACLSPSEIETVAAKFGRAGGVKSAAPIIYSSNFEPLLDLTKFPAYSKSAPINRVILRDTLADPVDAAGKLSYGAGFERYEILRPGKNDEKVRAWFADGSYDDCDILIGADGSHSKINKQLGLNNLKGLSTHISMIAKCELPTETFLKMSPALVNFPVMAFQDDKSLYFAAYLPDKATTPMDNVKPGISEDDLQFDDKVSSCMFGFHVPEHAAPPNAFELDTKEKWKFIKEALQGWSKEYQEIVELLSGSDVYMYRARVSYKPSKTWRKSVRTSQDVERGHPRVWLVGDAMHAMLPNRGMGGNQSMRDIATALPQLKRLAEVAKSGNPLSEKLLTEACSEYENEMIPRAFEWVKKSGGSTIVPFDAATFTGRMFVFFAARALSVAYYWTLLVGLFSKQSIIDDAPELRN